MQGSELRIGQARLGRKRAQQGDEHMREEMNDEREELVRDLGSASVQTLGEPEWDAYENVTMKDHKD